MSSPLVPSPPGPPAAPVSRRNRAHARQRGRLWSAHGVALAAVGCSPPVPRSPKAAVEGFRTQVTLGAPVSAQVCFPRAGDATGPRVILVHGTPGSASSWADYLLSPPPGMEVLALDRPGFGSSSPAGAMTSLAAQAAAVAALRPTDGRPVVLLGHSLGGPIVARVAAEHPARVTAIVLLEGRNHFLPWNSEDMVRTAVRSALEAGC